VAPHVALHEVLPGLLRIHAAAPMGAAKLSTLDGEGLFTWARAGLSDRVLTSSGDDRGSTSQGLAGLLFVNEPDLKMALDARSVGPAGHPRR